MRLATAARSQELDRTASRWGLDSSALVEAAARSCVGVLLDRAADILPRAGEGLCILAGAGHNGADALVMARILLFKRLLLPDQLCVVLHREPDLQRLPTPLRLALESMAALSVRVLVWDGADGFAAQAMASSRVLIDGLVGTGVKGPLRGSLADMVLFCRALRDGQTPPLVVAIDLPSGLHDAVVTDGAGEPVLPADFTLAIEPASLCLFTPNNRNLCGQILPVGSIFPPALLDTGCPDTLLPDEPAKRDDVLFIAPVDPDSWKTRRGQVSIWAGDTGTAGASLLCARAAQAAGAGYVKLVVPQELYPSLAGSAGGVVLSPEPSGNGKEPAAIALPEAGTLLAGPGWIPATAGIEDPSRRALLEALCAAESRGRYLVLDAGALPAIAASGPQGHAWRFGGTTVLTPHPGEFAALCALTPTELLQNPDAPLRAAAARHSAVIVLKGSLTRVAHPDGRLAILDGRFPALACAGSGDVLAGLVAALLSRGPAAPLAGNSLADKPLADKPPTGSDFCFRAACLAVRLHLQAARELARSAGFFDPAALAAPLARICAELFLTGATHD